MFHELGTAIDPRRGENLLERYGPLAVVVAWLLVTIALIFGYVPSTDASMAGYGTLAGIAGYYVRSMGEPAGAGRRRIAGDRPAPAG